MAANKMPVWAQALADTLISVVSNSEPVQAVRDGTPRRIADQLGEWIAHLSQSATTQWTPALLRRRTCVFCDSDAMGKCEGCQDMVCLAHAYVSHRAGLLCDECVATVLEHAENRKTDPVQQAFEFFHLTQDASLDEVTLVYRARSKHAHPDQGGSTKRMKEVNGHFEVLKQYFEHRKVA